MMYWQTRYGLHAPVPGCFDVSSNEKTLDLDNLKKLVRKAELCRFCHSKLKSRYTRCRNLKEFSVTLLSLLIAALSGLYYRNILTNEYVLAAIFLIPLMVAVVQALDHTVFHWTAKISSHQAAVSTWGSWIREAGFLNNNFSQHSIVESNQKLSGIEISYRNCMETTAQIPNRLFLKYKRDFRRHRLKSQSIDGLQLSDFRFWKRVWPDTKNKQ